jgi:hypothetical protein
VPGIHGSLDVNREAQDDPSGYGVQGIGTACACSLDMHTNLPIKIRISHPPGLPAAGLPVESVIDVHVEHDDGWVSYAAITGCRWRCYVNTAERRAYWEMPSGASDASGDQWIPTPEAAVDLPQQLRVAMHRAAACGLVASGLRL